MNKLKVHMVISFLFIDGLLMGCALVKIHSSTVETIDISFCLPPPSTFSSADLVGTWTAGRTDWSDTITIRQDGTYIQKLHLFTETSQYNYESAPQPWRVDTSTTTIPYLHLTGYRVCAYWPDIDCDQEGGGDGYWIDFCYKNPTEMPLESLYEGRGVQMLGEGIFLVMGAPENSIVFSLLARGMYSTWTFFRISP